MVIKQLLELTGSRPLGVERTALFFLFIFFIRLHYSP